jgi:hypothetical protein
MEQKKIRDEDVQFGDLTMIAAAKHEPMNRMESDTGGWSESDIGHERGASCVEEEDDDDILDMSFGDRGLFAKLGVAGGAALVAGETREFYVHRIDDDMIYLECPLCGNDGSIYGGNRFYTQACCYFGRSAESGNISLEVERWTAQHLLAGESIDQVYTALTGLRSGRIPTRRDYVERIYAILHDPRTADLYERYLATGDDGSERVSAGERDYYANEVAILAAEEDEAHERAADAAELSASDPEEGF